jgi:hypothetical protein
LIGTSGRIGVQFNPESAMKRLAEIVFIAAAVLLFMIPSAKADSSVYFNGSYAFANNGVGIPPYGGTLNGQPADFYCVDFSHDIVGGQSWEAIVTPVSPTTNYSATDLDNGTDYVEFAWLLTQEQQTTNQTTIAEDQWAIWSLSGATDPYGNAAAILANAETQLTAADFTGAGWEILTPDPKSAGQEFMVDTPEPTGLLLLAIGLCGLFIVKRREWFAFGSSTSRAN